MQIRTGRLGDISRDRRPGSVWRRHAWRADGPGSTAYPQRWEMLHEKLILAARGRQEVFSPRATTGDKVATTAYSLFRWHCAHAPVVKSLGNIVADADSIVYALDLVRLGKTSRSSLHGRGIPPRNHGEVENGIWVPTPGQLPTPDRKSRARTYARRGILLCWRTCI